MINAAEDVLDPELKIGLAYSQHGHLVRNNEDFLAGGQQGGLRSPIGPLQPQQHFYKIVDNAGKGDRLPR